MKRFILYTIVVALLSVWIPAPASKLAYAAGDTSPTPTPAPSDISGTWAEASIKQGLEKGLIKGYEDGTFRPDAPITRAELAALFNRAFGFAAEVDTSMYSDVPASKWYAKDVALAKAAGYMQGDKAGTFRPESPISRQEAAAVIARLLALGEDGAAAAVKFADADAIAAWARGEVGAVVASGVMEGYAGNRFGPLRTLTRAESVVILERASAYDAPKPASDGVPSRIVSGGVYGPASGVLTIEGDVAIDAPNTTLRNVKITGNLLLGAGIGNGDVSLDGVTVLGATTVDGGGVNSIHILNSELTRIIITKVDGQVRVVIEGSTSVDQVTVSSGGVLQVAGGSGASFGTVLVDTNGTVSLDGEFPNVVVVSAATVNLTSGSVGTLTLSGQAAGANVNLGDNTTVTSLNVSAPATIDGTGAITSANISSNGVSIAQIPTNVTIETGVTANVGGTASGGTASGGTASGGTAPQLPSVALTLSNASTGGFDVALQPAVPGLAASDFIVLDESGMPALVHKIGSRDGGRIYRVEGYFTGALSYGVTIVKPGYRFSPSGSIPIPDVPVLTGAMLSPEGDELTLLFSQELAPLPASPAGIAVSKSGGVIVNMTDATLSTNKKRITLVLEETAVAANLSVSYTPGTIASTTGKPLAAFAISIVTDGSSASGLSAYYRMQGRPIGDAASALQTDFALDMIEAATALLAGGYSQVDLVGAMHTVYGESHEDMPGWMIEMGIGAYPLFAGMEKAGILNVYNLGKNISFYMQDVNGAAESFIRVLKMAEHEEIVNGEPVTVIGYTEEEAAGIAIFFDAVERAEALKKVYGTTAERAAEIVYVDDESIEKMGTILKDVYDITAEQAAAMLKAEGRSSQGIGRVLWNVYQTPPEIAANLLRTIGFDSPFDGYSKIGLTLTDPESFDLDANRLGAVYREAGWDYLDALQGTNVDAVSGYARLRASGYNTLEYADYFLARYFITAEGAVEVLHGGGYGATEVAKAIMAISAKHALNYSRADVFGFLTVKYPTIEAADAVRKVLGGSAGELGNALAAKGVPSAQTSTGGATTVTTALIGAGYSPYDIASSYLFPTNAGISIPTASGAVFEFRKAGLQLGDLTRAVPFLMGKTSDNTRWGLVQMLAASSVPNAEGIVTPGYSASEIAQYFVDTRMGNEFNLANDFMLTFTGLETVQAMKGITGASPVKMLEIINRSSLCGAPGSCTGYFGAEALRDVYGLDAGETLRALKATGLSVYAGNALAAQVLRTAYNFNTPAENIEALKGAGFNVHQIGYILTQIPIGSVALLQSLKEAGYTSIDVARYLNANGMPYGDLMTVNLNAAGYDLTEVAQALRANFWSLGPATNPVELAAVVQQVQDWITAANVYMSGNIGTAVAAAFEMDQKQMFALLASDMRARPDSATAAALALKSAFPDTTFAEMAAGLNTAGYAQADVLAGIFQAYCEGNIFNLNVSTVETLRSVLLEVYDVADDDAQVAHMLKPLGMTEVENALFFLGTTLGKNEQATVRILATAYELDAKESIYVLLKKMNALNKPLILQAVSDYYSVDALAVFAAMQYENFFNANETFAHLQSLAPELDSNAIARLMKEGGYAQHEVMHAIYDVLSGDRALAIAQALAGIYGVESMNVVAYQLHVYGYGARTLELLKTVFPDRNYAEIITAMKVSGYDTQYVFSKLSDLDAGDLGDDRSMAVILKSYGFTASQAKRLMNAWGYDKKEILRQLLQVNGYSTFDVGKTTSGLGSGFEIAVHLRSLGVSTEDAANVLHYSDGRPVEVANYMYQAGWKSADDAAKLFATVKIPRLAILMRLWETRQYLGANWSNDDLTWALARNADLSLAELGTSYLLAREKSYFSDIQMYNAIKAVAAIGTNFMGNVIPGELMNMVVDLNRGIPFIVLREGGMDAKYAATIMHNDLKWDWIPATIQLVQAGYGSGETWNALWDVYRNELGFQILNIMSAIAPLGSLGLADNLTLFQSLTRAALKKAMIYYFTN